MIGLLDAYGAHFKAYFATQLQYRVALLIWLIGFVLEPVVYLVVWSTVARTSGGLIGGYDARSFAAYFIAIMIVNHLTFTWIMHEFEMRVRLGEFSPKLLRPIHPIHGDVADNITYKALTVVTMLPVAAVLSLLFHPAFNVTPANAALFVPALVLAFSLRFVVEWMLALAAFWTTRVDAVNQMYFSALLFMSGRLVPLTLLPAPLQTFASILPFRWMIAFPVEVLLGRLTFAQELIGLLTQLLWLGLTLAALSVIWRVGIRKYTGVGA